MLDVDGTLLDSAGVLRPRVIETVRRVVESGCRVTLATGRRFRSAGPIAAALGLDFPLILHGGALVADASDGRILYHRHLRQPAAAAAIRALTDAGWQPIIYGNGFARERLYSGPPERDDDPARRYLTAFPEIVTRLPADELTRIPDPLGISVLGDPERLVEALRLTEGLPGGRSFITAFQRFGCHLLEVVSAECSKAAAIEWICRESGIDLAEVLAIGDHRNDLEMIRAVGFGVAMGDAPPELREAAAALTGTAEEDGVADALERYILGEAIGNRARSASEKG